MLKELLRIFRSDNLLNQAFNRSVEMLQLAETMFEAARTSLRERDDADVGLDIYAADKQINAYEQEVRRKVLTHLSVGNGADLPAGLVLVSIVIDIERLGDFAKNVVELALRHPASLHCGAYEDDINALERSVANGFRGVLQGLPNSDSEAAAAVMEAHWGNARRADAVVNRLIDHDEADLSCVDAVSIALYTRYLKRCSAHLMNIASSVVNPFERIGFRPDPAPPGEPTEG
jgi:phosphate transport system protein